MIITGSTKGRLRFHVTGPNTLGVVFYALGILHLSFAICAGSFLVHSASFNFNSTSPYIIHYTDTMMTHYDTWGIEIP
jgi:hypothetical protein